MRRALYVAPFGELADPCALVDVAVAAEESGWDGLFVWDHIWRRPTEVAEVGDAWITLAAIATATTRIRLGPMVVPLARRRPQKVARESVALDWLSRGRLTLGVGLGVDTGGELARFGEVADDRARGDVLDEALELLLALWSGDDVHHAGPCFTADGVRFLPTPRQRPRIPTWGAARGASTGRPLRRAASLDGIFPVGATKDQLARIVDAVRSSRGTLDGYDVAVVRHDDDGDGAALADLGVTWEIRSLGPTATARDALVAAGAAPR